MCASRLGFRVEGSRAGGDRGPVVGGRKKMQGRWECTTCANTASSSKLRRANTLRSLHYFIKGSCQGVGRNAREGWLVCCSKVSGNSDKSHVR